MAQHRTKSIVKVVSDYDRNFTDANSSNPNIPILQNDTTCNRMYNSHSLVSSEIMDSFLTICLTRNIDRSSDDVHHFLERLKKITKQVECFSDVDECIDYLTDVDQKRVVMVLYGYPNDQLVPFFSSISQVCSIYTFDHSGVSARSGGDKIKKFKGVYRNVEQICH